jgi:peptidoglycan/LPS O-acetylase OafA/YrhL
MLRRKPLGLVLIAIFGVLALIDWVQVLLALLGHSDNPSALVALHFGTGAAAAASGWGSWRRKPWTPIAAVTYGVLTAALLLALPSLLNLPLDAPAGLRAGAAAVLIFALLSAAYFRADSRQSARQISTERANDR